MIKTFCALLVCLMVCLPLSQVSAQSDSSLQKIEQLLALIKQLQQQLASLQKQQAQRISYDVADVKTVKYQEVYDDGRNAMYRYELILLNGSKIVVVVPKRGSITEIEKKFKDSGYTGVDVKRITNGAKRIPGLRWQTCSLEADKRVYEKGEPITLTWNTDAKYVAFNAYGSSDKKAYLDENFRASSGSVTIKVDKPGRHYINMNVYPWQERFASGACTVVFQVGAAESESATQDREKPEDPVLGYFVVEPAATFRQGEMVTLRYGVEKSSQCGIYAENQTSKTTVVAKAGNKSLRVSNLPLPEWAEPGTTFKYVLRCDSWPNSYYGSQVDALVEEVTVTVTE